MLSFHRLRRHRSPAWRIERCLTDITGAGSIIRVHLVTGARDSRTMRRCVLAALRSLLRLAPSSCTILAYRNEDDLARKAPVVRADFRAGRSPAHAAKKAHRGRHRVETIAFAGGMVAFQW